MLTWKLNFHRMFFFYALSLLTLVFAGCESDRAKRLPFPGAPPLVAHDLKSGMQNCLLCHREGANKAPKTPHPKRTNCLQCHVPGNFENKLLTESTFKKL